mmetsp:Transcript_1873/g.5457  ORF Transcript_1873/g.5457 Transcript_1873/m.5457 type:complete len:295 (+) Transcript_1873:300-1184(+)
MGRPLCVGDECKHTNGQAIHSRERRLLDIYSIGPAISIGTTSTVWLATHNDTGRQFACKCLPLDGSPGGRAEAMREIELSDKARHPAVSQMIDHFETDTGVFMLSEILPGGNLMECIALRSSAGSCVSEAEARALAQTLLPALAFLHSQSIAHRDIKPENILLGDPGDLSTAKIADFGLACVAESESALTEPCGTPSFTAPEVIVGQGYGVQCDMWSLGVMLYVTLSGELPFYGSTATESLRHTLSGKYRMEGPLWDDAVSEACKDLLRKLLTTDPRERLTASAALRHPWLDNK